MNLEEERKAFEEVTNIDPDWSFKFDEELQQYVALDYEMQLQVDEFNEHWDIWRAAWQAAKTKAVPEGFVLVEKKNTEDWYLDDFEGMWWDHDGIDGSLCELDIGQVQAVEHKEYLITESNTLYATRAWDDANDQVDCWQFFKTKDEAEKAAAYCKEKFNDEPVEAQEQSNNQQEYAELNAIADSRKDQKRIRMNLEDL